MPARILLGPQSPTSNLRRAADAIGAEGPAVVITAGWRDSEGEIDDLREQLGRPLEDLSIYQRAEVVFAGEPALRELKRERQDKLRKLQKLYRLRLRPTLLAARKLMRAEADPELLRVEQRAAIAQVRALDRHHLRRIQSIHKEFNQRRSRLDLSRATAERDAVHEQIANAGLVLIAGGHVAVLLNRMRLFQLAGEIARKPLIAWSAGAMALSERIVLFHDHAPQGRRDAELLDTGLGIVRQRILLPHARTRLDWKNTRRMALLSRRFAPAACCTLDSGSLLKFEDDRLVEAHGSVQVTSKGRRQPVSPS
ncbi:MAG: type 1 glutamine amidotransferase-like domain-containing protein [Xanthomonadales bacterium]|nr:type 1 glutamine amidotransferase-like domain-containing protein [Xanthomonadales bacterium]